MPGTHDAGAPDTKRLFVWFTHGVFPASPYLWVCGSLQSHRHGQERGTVTMHEPQGQTDATLNDLQHAFGLAGQLEKEIVGFPLLSSLRK